MTKTLSTLTIMTSLVLSLAAPGCDQQQPNERSDRSAQLVMELDGQVVETFDVAQPQQLQTDLTAWAEGAPGPVCESGDVELDLVLEQDGETLAVYEDCAAADGSHSPLASDSLTTTPDAQNNPFFCASCQSTGQCFPCCKCDGGTTGECTLLCWS
ncbi:MAG: hypothetical protein AAGF11_48740 [Myxococcota bacterium]